MTLAHDVAGNGPTVVLLHSTVCDRRMWDPQVPVLVGAGFRVVRCDFRGFGETPAPTGPFSNADDVVALLDELGVTATALVGASGGGRAALEIAARQPQRITALALLCPAWGNREPSAELAAYSDAEDALIEAGDVAAATELNVRTWVGPAADEATRQQVREMQRHAFEVQLAGEDVPSIKAEPDLAAITAPAWLVTGRHDLPDFRMIGADLAKRIAGARPVELDWAGHLPGLERPDLLNPLLLDFLTSAPGEPQLVR